MRKSEVMLEEDAIRFDTFLKENDKKAHDAIKTAEAETKAKQDRVMDIKKLNQNIQVCIGVDIRVLMSINFTTLLYLRVGYPK